MQDLNTPEAVRLQLLRNGYTPIRNYDKRTFMVGWPTAEITEDEIRRWTRRFKRDVATGIRVENGLCVIDFDVDDKAAMDAIWEAVLGAVPVLDNDRVLVRRGKGEKEAWYVRTEEAFGRIFSHGWFRPGATEDDGVHRVEIFGGAMPRQFGSFGPHTFGDDGEVLVEYRWADETSPLDVSQSELVPVTKAECFLICDAVDRVLKELGWQQALKSTKGEGEHGRVYDLTEEMHFDLDTGERVSMQQLRSMAAAGASGYRCSASWLEGPSAINTSRCIIGHTHDGRVTIWESAGGQTHLEKEFAPRLVEYEADVKKLAARLGEIASEREARRKNRITSSDDATSAATKLLNTYAFCPNQQLGVVPIWARSMDQGMVMSAFRTMMMPNCDEDVGPRGGRQITNPVDIWSSSDLRKTVQGIRMRPDQQRPLYSDAEGDWVNCYCPPAHDAAGGSPDVGVEFIDYLLPDEEERLYFKQWLSYKFQHPHVPGPAIVMVARKQGTGRGTLGELMKRLFGANYVVALPFSIFAGRSYQSQYTDWGATSVMALISESSEIEGSVYRAKTNTYEHLKELIEPRPHEKMFVSKGSRSFKAISCTSYIIATNNVDAISVPETDRRIAVLANGDPADEAFWVRVNAWLEIDANIAAFAAWLTSVDLTGYSPFVAPKTTDAKREMVELSGSDIDRALEIAFDGLQAEVYTASQIVNGVKVVAEEHDLRLPDRWHDVVHREAQKRGYRVGIRKGTNWQPQFDGKRLAVYATSKAAAKFWKEHAALREEVIRNGSTAVVTGIQLLAKLQKDREPK